MAAQVLTKDAQLLKVRLRHLLQYMNTTRTLGLLYAYTKHDLTEFAVFSDASALKVRIVDSPFLRFCLALDPRMAESSAEAEFYAHYTSRKSARNVRLLIHESLSSALLMTLRHGATATIYMLEELGWRAQICVHLR